MERKISDIKAELFREIEQSKAALRRPGLKGVTKTRLRNIIRKNEAALKTINKKITGK